MYMVSQVILDSLVVIKEFLLYASICYLVAVMPQSAITVIRVPDFDNS